MEELLHCPIISIQVGKKIGPCNREKLIYCILLPAEKLFDDLKKKKIDCHVISIHGEPSPDDIDNAVNALNDKGIDVVVGIGGGSVLDAGKAISAMIYRSESVVRFLEGVGDMEHPGTKFLLLQFQQLQVQEVKQQKMLLSQR